MVHSIETQGLRRIFTVAFALIFAIPLLFFFLIVVQFNLLESQLVHFAFVGILACSLTGYILLRQIVDRIVAISSAARLPDNNEGTAAKRSEYNELKLIANNFATLVKRLEDSTENLDHRICELTTLRELTEISTKIIDMKLLFGIVLEKLLITSDSSFGMILSLSKDGDRLKLEAARGIKDVNFNEISVNETILGRIIYGNQIFTSGNPAQEKGYNPNNDTIFSGKPFFAKVIKARGTTIGILCLSRGTGAKSYQGSILDFITTVLGHVAFAFDNAQIIYELKEAYDDLKNMQQELISLERHEAINQTVVTLSDKINNPLTVIQGYTELLRRNIGQENPRILRSLDIIQNSIRRCSDVMSKLRDIPEHNVTTYAKGNTKILDIGNILPTKDDKKNNPHSS